MKLRFKTLLLTAGVLAVGFAAMYLASRAILSSGFETIEQAGVQRDVSRVQETLQSELRALQAQALDWSLWDDTFQYLRKPFPQYVQANLNIQSLANLRWNIVLLIDSNRRIVGSAGIDHMLRQPMPIPPEWRLALCDLVPATPLLPERPLTGLAVLPGRTPVMVVVAPVYSSALQGPSPGHLVVVRLLDGREISRQRRGVNLSFDVQPIGSPSETPVLGGAYRIVSRTQKHVVAEAALPVLASGDTLRLVVTSPRDMYQLARNTLDRLGLGVILWGFAISLFVVALIEALVFRRLAPLARFAEAIARSGDMQARLQVTGNDELSQLSAALNRMLDSLAVAFDRNQALVHKLEHANRDLRDIVRVSSHDLRTPVRGIGSLASQCLAASDTNTDPDLYEALQLIDSRAKRLYRMLDAVCEFAEATSQPVRTEAMDVSLVVLEVAFQLQPGSRRVIPPPPGCIVKSDPSRLRIILRHLMENALRYVPAEGGCVEVSCHQQAKQWIIEVKDNGPGIDPKYHERIFDLLGTLSSRDKMETAGVGLALVRRLVEDAGGRIDVQSTPGEGAVFRFTIIKPYEHDAEPFSHGVT